MIIRQIKIVCPSCQGVPGAICPACKNTGVQTVTEYETQPAPMQPIMPRYPKYPRPKPEPYHPAPVYHKRNPREREIDPDIFPIRKYPSRPRVFPMPKKTYWERKWKPGDPQPQWDSMPKTFRVAMESSIDSDFLNNQGLHRGA